MWFFSNRHCPPLGSIHHETCIRRVDADYLLILSGDSLWNCGDIGYTMWNLMAFIDRGFPIASFDNWRIVSSQSDRNAMHDDVGNWPENDGTGWWFGCHEFYFPINIGLRLSSQLTNSYFSEGWPNHQPDGIMVIQFVHLGQGAFWWCMSDFLVERYPTDRCQTMTRLQRSSVCLQTLFFEESVQPNRKWCNPNSSPVKICRHYPKFRHGTYCHEGRPVTPLPLSKLPSHGCADLLKTWMVTHFFWWKCDWKKGLLGCPFRL